MEFPYTEGQRVRVYDTDYCRRKPDDLRLDCYREGIITKRERVTGNWYRFYYVIDKLIINKKSFPHSWKIGTEGDFVSDGHNIRILSNQLMLQLTHEKEKH